MVLVKCPRCGYVWNYRGRRRYVTCPRCYTKFSVVANRVGSGGVIDMFMAEGDVLGVIKECVEEIGGVFMEGDGTLDLKLPDGGTAKLRECLVRRGVRLVSDRVAPQEG